MPHLVEAERIFARSSDRERDTQEWMLTIRGEILMNQRNFGAAVPVLEQALTLSRSDVADPTNHALAMWTLARALHELGREQNRVHALADGAYTIFASLGEIASYDRDVVARFLKQLSLRFPVRQRAVRNK
jgi:predicted Zn-dependent protease